MYQYIYICIYIYILVLVLIMILILILIFTYIMLCVHQSVVGSDLGYISYIKPKSKLFIDCIETHDLPNYHRKVFSRLSGQNVVNALTIVLDPHISIPKLFWR